MRMDGRIGKTAVFSAYIYLDNIPAVGAILEPDSRKTRETPGKWLLSARTADIYQFDSGFAHKF